MTTSQNQVDYDPKALRQLTVALMSNPTRDGLTEEQREGYRAAVTSIELLSRGATDEHLRAGYPDLPATAEDTAKADAILATVPPLPMPVEPPPVTLDRGNLRKLIEVMRAHPTIYLFPPEYQAGFRGCLATIEACLPQMPELYEGSLCPNIPELMTRLAKATSLTEVAQICEPIAWVQWMAKATAEDAEK